MLQDTKDCEDFLKFFERIGSSYTLRTRTFLRIGAEIFFRWKRLLKGVVLSGS